jgi:hypothetical protein
MAAAAAAAAAAAGGEAQALALSSAARQGAVAEQNGASLVAEACCGSWRTMIELMLSVEELAAMTEVRALAKVERAAIASSAGAIVLQLQC